MPLRMKVLGFGAVASLVLLAACNMVSDGSKDASATAPSSAHSLLVDGNDGDDWPAYGGLYNEQHFSALGQINTGNVSQLGLAWSADLPATSNPMTAPIEVDGVIYLSYGYSVVHAFDAVTGALLWRHDPHAPEASGVRLKNGWGIRGIAYWDGAVFTGTQDGRLIALDALTGKKLWSQQTLEPGSSAYITGAPRVFNGKVIIGFGGADVGANRGYVSAYDAKTGDLAWRFYTVPGNPAKGFENDAMAKAARTWTGEWWRGGGGGTVWNAITYDPELDRIYLGTGNGNPWNQKARSPGGGDNLFLCSIIALDAKTGRYLWHYQTNPAETWDYNSSMDMTLADLKIDGQPRKVILHAPKNGFLYVIDRADGRLISAEPIVPNINWATHIDLATGRPAAIDAARYPGGRAEVYPSILGAHNWPAQSFNPQLGLIFIPTLDMPISYDDRGLEPAAWRASVVGRRDPAVRLGPADMSKAQGAGLLAWDPVKKRRVWYNPSPGMMSPATLATAGGLVFQGRLDGHLAAYRATDGAELWRFDALNAVAAQPISYAVGGKQYVAVVAGFGGAAGGMNAQFGWDYRQQLRRLLVFQLGGTGSLSGKRPSPVRPLATPHLDIDPAAAARGGTLFNSACNVCHGPGAVAGGSAPDLRAASSPTDAQVFRRIVRDGTLVPAGMPQFGELSETEVEDLRHYIRSRAQM
jgi:quinohemoprotein ethanol dehydrogenase